MKKKLIPCIYLKNKMAVTGLTDSTIIETEPVRLVQKYCESKADEILVFDLSEGDKEHEEAIDSIKEICS